MRPPNLVRVLMSVSVLSVLWLAQVQGADSKPATQPVPIRIKSLGQLARLLHLHKPQHLAVASAGTPGPNVGTGTIVGAPTLTTTSRYSTPSRPAPTPAP